MWEQLWEQGDATTSKDDVQQEHPAVSDTRFPLFPPRFQRLFDRSLLSSTTWPQGDSVVLALQESRTTSCAPWALHIQILQSNLVQSVANFHNRDLGFGAVSHRCAFWRCAFLCHLVENLLACKTRVYKSVVFRVNRFKKQKMRLWVFP